MRRLASLVWQVPLVVGGVALLVAAGKLLLDVLATAFFMFFVGLTIRGDPAWPPIADPAALVAECAAQLDARAAGAPGSLDWSWVRRERWGRQTLALRPLRVRAEGKSCTLFYHNRFAELVWGYEVYPDEGAAAPAPCDRPSPCDGGYVRPTADARILEWESTRP